METQRPPRNEVPYQQIYAKLDVNAPLTIVRTSTVRSKPPKPMSSHTDVAAINIDTTSAENESKDIKGMQSNVQTADPSCRDQCQSTPTDHLASNGQSSDITSSELDPLKQDENKNHTPETGTILPPLKPRRQLYYGLPKEPDGVIDNDKGFRLPDHYLRPNSRPRSHLFDAFIRGSGIDWPHAMHDLCGSVGYDMDETDMGILGYIAATYKDVSSLNADIFENIMALLELGAALLTLEMPAKAPRADETRQCVVCKDAECDNENAIVFCDGCDIAVHQDCYGVPFIPEGQWLCRHCQLARVEEASCAFCPWKSGAFKQTENQQWAHVVCGLWIPELTVPNDAFMEPIQDVWRVDRERWTLRCYICRRAKCGACIQCAEKSCFTAFHATCAQAAGLYMYMPENSVAQALQEPGELRAYCDRHTPKNANILIDTAAARRSLELELEKESFSQHFRNGSLWSSGPLHSYWRTSTGALVVPQVVVNAIQYVLSSRFETALPEPVLDFICRYWTLKKDHQGTMFSRSTKQMVDTAQHTMAMRSSRAAEHEGSMTRISQYLNAAKDMLEIVQSASRESGTLIGVWGDHSTSDEVSQKGFVDKSLENDFERPTEYSKCCAEVKSVMREKGQRSNPMRVQSSSLSPNGRVSKETVAHGRILRRDAAQQNSGARRRRSSHR